MISPNEIAAVASRAELIHDADTIAAVIDRMAREITAKLADSNPILLCVMNGGLLFTAELALRLDFPLQIDYLHSSRYGDATRGGNIEHRIGPGLDLRGRAVLVVDDILDEGHTLQAVLRLCRERGATRALSAILVDKQRPRGPDSPRPDFIGLPVPNHYVFGYGMDYRGYLRNCNGVYALGEEDEIPPA